MTAGGQYLIFIKFQKKQNFNQRLKL